jgi:hypothetical protein
LEDDQVCDICKSTYDENATQQPPPPSPVKEDPDTEDEAMEEVDIPSSPPTDMIVGHPRPDFVTQGNPASLPKWTVEILKKLWLAKRVEEELNAPKLTEEALKALERVEPDEPYLCKICDGTCSECSCYPYMGDPENLCKVEEHGEAPDLMKGMPGKKEEVAEEMQLEYDREIDTLDTRAFMDKQALEQEAEHAAAIAARVQSPDSQGAPWEPIKIPSPMFMEVCDIKHQPVRRACSKCLSGLTSIIYAKMFFGANRGEEMDDDDKEEVAVRVARMNKERQLKIIREFKKLDANFEYRELVNFVYQRGHGRVPK